jgi:hypothetical protein
MHARTFVFGLAGGLGWCTTGADGAVAGCGEAATGTLCSRGGGGGGGTGWRLGGGCGRGGLGTGLGIV